VEPPVAVNLLFKQLKVRFETGVEVASRIYTKSIFQRLLHFEEDGGAVVHCHMHDFFVLVSVKELAVLVDYQLVSGIYHSSAIGHLRLLSTATISIDEAVLHKAGENLRELHF